MPWLGEPRWVDRLVVEAIHFDLVRAHGGLSGLRDENGLESALARPRQHLTYRPESDVAALAAAYAFGLTRNHPFNDGNKRVAFVTMGVFLGLNGYEFEAPESEVVTVMLDLAAGELDEDQLAGWIRPHLLPTRP
ncbi:MAG TPA: type II toxin-antitoxin system death-on-curing family toxin [Coriobacteriia bacterium]